MSLLDLDTAQFNELAQQVRQDYQDLQAKNLNLNLTRGKPSNEQLDFSHDLLSLPGDDPIDADGVDVRNYGGLLGIKQLREIWANALGRSVDNTIAADSSSLNITFDLLLWSYTFGNNDSARPWSQEERSAGSARCRVTTATSPSPKNSASRWYLFLCLTTVRIWMPWKSWPKTRR